VMYISGIFSVSINVIISKDKRQFIRAFQQQ
jgi:hypothetical protein